jgi:hypothetical protein
VTFESAVQEQLRQLAATPGPANLADQALAGARRVRRRRGAVATALVAAGVTIAVAVPTLAGGDPAPSPPAAQSSPAAPSSPAVSSTPAPGPVVCRTATDEATPPQGAPRGTWPDFVHVVIAALPHRDDYFVQWAYGICPSVDMPGSGLSAPNARVIINLGPQREHGLVVVALYQRLYPDSVTCATVPPGDATPLFCTDAAGPAPMVLATTNGQRGRSVLAVYPDGRAVVSTTEDSPLDAAALRAVVTDPALVAALGEPVPR